MLHGVPTQEAAIFRTQAQLCRKCQQCVGSIGYASGASTCAVPETTTPLRSVLQAVSQNATSPPLRPRRTRRTVMVASTDSPTHT